MVNCTIIPTTTDDTAAPFDQRMTLTGVPYNLRFQWSARGQVWLLSLYSDAGDLIVGFVPIVNNTLIFYPYQADPRVPPGQFLALANTMPELNAQRGDLGSRVVLTYTEAA